MSVGDQSNLAVIVEFSALRIELTGCLLRSTVIFGTMDDTRDIPDLLNQGATA